MPFSIMFDETVGRIRVVRSGFWEPDEVSDYGASLMITLRKAELRATPFDILIDFSDAQILASAAAERMKPVATSLAVCGARRIAWVTASALGRMQVRRLVGDASHFRMFDARRSAEAWLNEAHP